jgi:hypothetical protein
VQGGWEGLPSLQTSKYEPKDVMSK